jgi:hypothetical protein
MRKLLKRRWLWVTLLLAVVITAGYALLPATGVRISGATCDKIQLGWSEKQVNELLPHTVHIYRSDRDGNGCLWGDENGNLILIWFARDARVSEKEFRPTDLSLLEIARIRIENRIRALWPRKP